MNDTIKELLEVIPIEPENVHENEVTFKNQAGDYYQITVNDDMSYNLQYRIDYKFGNCEIGIVNFFDIEREVTLFMKKRV